MSWPACRAHAEPTWDASWPCPLIMNRTLPCRLNVHIRWSMVRASSMVRYIATTSASLRPSAV